MPRLDWTISLGNILSALLFLFTVGAAWWDLRWRVRNLETWRVAHEVDSKQRDELIKKLELSNEHLTTLITAIIGVNVKKR